MSTAPSTAGTGRSWTDAGPPKLRTANARILTSMHWHLSENTAAARVDPGRHAGGSHGRAAGVAWGCGLAGLWGSGMQPVAACVGLLTGIEDLEQAGHGLLLKPFPCISRCGAARRGQAGRIQWLTSGEQPVVAQPVAQGDDKDV